MLDTPSHGKTDSITSITQEVCGSEEMCERGWRVETTSPDDSWIKLFHCEVKQPRQGWKIHVSATTISAEEVLRRALPILLSEPTHFKIAASLHALDALNRGKAGLRQIGKFITVYPADNAQAVWLAVELDAATHGLAGPVIRSDRGLSPGSLVYYRFGSFSERLAYNRNGELLRVIETPTGELVEDRRSLAYSPPVWAEDPFLLAKVSKASASTSSTSLLQGNFFPVALIYPSPRGAVFDAIDIKGRRRCVLKQAYADAIVGASSQSAQNMLRHEAHILKQLEALPFLPRSFALVEDHAMLWLAMEYIEGTLLKHYIEAVTRQSSIVPNETILAWMQELAGMLAQLHQHGIVYRDLKSVNTIVSPDGHLRLIDFGISYDLTSSDAPFLGGSPGYASPQQRANEPAAITDDMYSFGALCYFLATGADPALAPDTTLLLSRPLAEMNPLLPAHLRYVIARCLAPDPGDRFPCMQDVLATLQDRHIWVGGEKEEKEDSLERAQRRYLRYAQELCETLEVAVQTVVDGKIGPAGIQLSPPGSTSVVLRDLGSGMAGVLLVLCEFVQHMQSLPLRAVVRAGADWLLRSQPLEGPILPGLYIGEAGVGLALLRAGQILADQSLITGATQQAARVAASPFTYPDIFHGTAGRLKFSLLLWYATKEGEYVDEALRAGNALLAQAEEARDGGLYWRIPQGYGNLSGKVYLGYGHGVAGIADALLDAYQASGQDVYLDAAHRAAAWLLQRAMPVGEQQQGLGWPEIVFGQEEKIEGKQVCAPFWCHGANGIGHLFLRMAREQSHTQYLDVASKAAQAVAQGTRWSGPSRCHGLAGSIEFLLDVYEVTKEEQWFTSAFTFAHILEAYATEREEQRLWLSEPPEVITPGLLTGYAGIAATFLRIGETGTPMEPHFPRIY